MKITIKNTSNTIHGIKNSNKLQLVPVDVDEDYCTKWNVKYPDFLCFTKKGELINDTLYRLPGLGSVDLNNDDYIILFKMVESYYDDNITKNEKKKRHLDNISCILNKNGEEVKVFNTLERPYLIRNSQVYSLGKKYYNIVTGEFYCDAYNTMSSDLFLFLENRFDKDKDKRGIMKINKKDGSWEFFK